MRSAPPGAALRRLRRAGPGPAPRRPRGPTRQGSAARRWCRPRRPSAGRGLSVAAWPTAWPTRSSTAGDPSPSPRTCGDRRREPGVSPLEPAGGPGAPHQQHVAPRRVTHLPLFAARHRGARRHPARLGRSPRPASACCSNSPESCSCRRRPNGPGARRRSLTSRRRAPPTVACGCCSWWRSSPRSCSWPGSWTSR